MFLWVSLVVRTLEDTPISSVLETVVSIPPDINMLYSHLLGRLHGSQATVAREILEWVVTAPRAMTTTELAIAWSIKNSY
jgi:hypothetical protein